MNFTPPYVLVLDVDGVLTDPQQKKITQPKILDEITAQLKNGIPVAFNTGRSLPWVLEKIIDPLKGIEPVSEHPELLQKVFISSEKGALWAGFNQNGEIYQKQDKTISVPKELIDMVKKLIDEKYSRYVAIDEGKLSMITAEMRRECPFKEFLEIQPRLHQEMLEITSKFQKTQELRVISTTIDVEIEDMKVGKNLGAVRVMKWLREQNIEPLEYIAVGDSKSDILMAEEFHREGKKTRFVFVGERLGNKKYDFPVEKTFLTYSEGALKSLEELKF